MNLVLDNVQPTLTIVTRSVLVTWPGLVSCLKPPSTSTYISVISMSWSKQSSTTFKQLKDELYGEIICMIWIFILMIMIHNIMFAFKWNLKLYFTCLHSYLHLPSYVILLWSGLVRTQPGSDDPDTRSHSGSGSSAWPHHCWSGRSCWSCGSGRGIWSCILSANRW